MILGRRLLCQDAGRDLLKSASLDSSKNICLTALKVLESSRNRILASKLIDIAINKKENVSTLYEPLSRISRFLLSDQYSYPNTEDSLGGALHQLLQTRLESDQLSLKEIALFGQTMQICRRTTIQVDLPQLERLSLAALRSSGKLAAFDLMDFVTGYHIALQSIRLPDSSSYPEWLKTMYKLHEKLESRLPQVDSLLQISRLIDAVSRSDHLDHALLSRLAVRAGELMSSARMIDPQIFLSLLTPLGRCEVFEEEFLDAAKSEILKNAYLYSNQALVQCFSQLQKYGPLFDEDVIDALCSAAETNLPEMSETHASLILIGLHRRRPKQSAQISSLMKALSVHCLKNWSSPGIATCIALVSKMSSFDPGFFAQGLSIVHKRGLHDLSLSQAQQLLGVLAHNQNSIPLSVVESASQALTDHLSSPRIVTSLTSMQCITILTALSSLRLRHEPLLIALFGTLTGSSRTVYTYSQLCRSVADVGSQLPKRPFKVQSCISALLPHEDNSAELTHLTSILHCIDELSAWSEVTVHLGLIIRSMLLRAGLHHLRAGSLAYLLQFCVHLKAGVTDEDIYQVDNEVGQYFALHAHETFRNELPVAKEHPVEPWQRGWVMKLYWGIAENLRRHQEFLKGNTTYLNRVKTAFDVAESLGGCSRRQLKRVRLTKPSTVEEWLSRLHYLEGSPLLGEKGFEWLVDLRSTPPQIDTMNCFSIEGASIVEDCKIRGFEFPFVIFPVTASRLKKFRDC